MDTRGVPPGARGPRLGDAPRLAVVLASRLERSRLDACLASLVPQCTAHHAELVVVRAGTLGDLEATYPSILFVETAAETPVAALRAAGVAVADGDVVAVAEDRGVVPPEWLGGLGAEPVRDWASSVAEFGSLLSEAAAGAGRAERAWPGPSAPLLSVIVPAHQAARYLRDSLEALAGSSLPRSLWELVVVDDASTDGTDLVAGQVADTVLRLAGNPHGPAYSRNRGFEFSRGQVLVFVDADVRIHRDALQLMAAEFTRDPTIGAVFGAFDDAPSAPGTVSQYRNLLYHYVHSEGEGDAETFWAGLGAVRRDVFVGAGTFDEWHYARPQIEDAELGRRIRRLGRRIVLRPQILGTHLKQWTLRDVVRTDYLHSGVPWAWLLLREGRSAPERALNMELIYRLSTGAVWLAIAALAAAPVIRSLRALELAALLVGLVGVLNIGFYRVLVRRLGLARTLAMFPVHLIHYVSNGAAAITGWLGHHLFGEPETPASVVALADTGVKTWPPRHARPRASVWTNPPGAPAEPDEDAP